MVEFLNKDKAYSEIVEIVSKADGKLVLISPYIKIPSDLLERLKYMDGKGIQTTVVCREKDLNTEVKSELRQLKNLDLRFDENLHAKCFYNEQSMVITSLNLYEHSQQHNREMGILLNAKVDVAVFKEALKEAEYIVNRAKRDSVTGGIVRDTVRETKVVAGSPDEERSRKARIPGRVKNRGYCIRCGESITYDLNTPYCPNCYRVWKKHKDPDHWEKFCHSCGRFDGLTTLNKPRCDLCYWESPR